MRVLVMIDSFKGTMTSTNLGEIMTQELKKKRITATYLPISDGGDGFLEALATTVRGRRVPVMAKDPLGRPINTFFLFDEANAAAYLELAKISGINLVQEEELNPLYASTFGLGEVARSALNHGAKQIIVGIGGSATNDGGAGMAEALGCCFYDKYGRLIVGLNGEKLAAVAKIDHALMESNINSAYWTVLSDVDNPLLGPRGAAYVYAPQKGANHAAVKRLEANMTRYASVVEAAVGTECKNAPGAGAAGGVGFAFHAFFKADFYSGIDYLLRLIDFKNLIEDYDCIITGEGKIDCQSFYGKAVSAVIREAADKRLLLVCAVNELKKATMQKHNIHKIHQIVGNIATLEASLAFPEKYFRMLSRQVAADLTGQ